MRFETLDPLPDLITFAATIVGHAEATPLNDFFRVRPARSISTFSDLANAKSTRAFVLRKI